MERAIYLASRADAHLIQTNPRVGAVLVHDGLIIGEGYHMRRGEAHAEVNCLKSVRQAHRHLIPNSTMYVTLEPCAHQGRTPSCARMLVEQGVKKVVISTLDPFPQVSGKGCEILRQGGIEVSIGLMEEECQTLAKVFFTNQREKRPYIILKWAESADGYIDITRKPSEEPAKISTPFVQLLNHKLRGENAGIMIGKGTLLMDSPSLSNRLYPLIPSPEVFLLDHTGSCRGIVEGRENWHVVSDEGDMEKMLNKLLEAGITSLIVEGGAKVHQSFINSGLWDTIRREISPDILHQGVAAPVLHSDLVPTRQINIDCHKILIYTQGKNSTSHTIPK